jgi:PAS domain-containing protein
VASEIDSLRQELAALRHELDDLRLNLPDAFVEGDLASDRVTFMNRVACQVFRCTPEQVTTLSLGTAFGQPGERVSGLLSRADQVLYASKGLSLRPKRRRPESTHGEKPGPS